MQLRGITGDSREVRHGYAFVAVRGFREDGHRFVDEAVQRGASVIIAESGRLNASQLKVPVIEVDDTRLALAQMAAEFYGFPSQRLYVIGITGTNGKTSTTCMISYLLKRQGIVCADIGSVGIHTPRSTTNTTLTTPDAVQIQRALAETVRASGTHAVIEASSHGLALHRLADIEFNLALLTNITADHLDFHHSYESYVQAKMKLFRMLAVNGVALLNGDAFELRQLSKEISRDTIFFGIKRNNDSFADRIEMSPQGIHFRWHYRGAEHDVKLRLIGVHQVLNALGAITAVSEAGIPPKAAAVGISDFPGVHRRLEWHRFDDFNVLDDYAHNPSGYRAAFAACAQLPARDWIIVAAVRGNRGAAINAANAAALAEGCERLRIHSVIVTDANDVVSPLDRVHPEEREVFLRVLKKKFPFREAGLHYRDSLSEALQTALEAANRDSMILLLGAQGMDPARGLLSGIFREKKVRSRTIPARQRWRGQGMPVLRRKSGS